jgi:integral membrane protein (TIGR01906 family)
MMDKVWPRLIQWLLVLMLPFLLIVVNFRIVNGRWFVRWEYGKAGFPVDDCCDYSLTTEERTYLAEVCVDYLAPGAPLSLLADLRLPNGDVAFNERELSHMEDVQVAFTQITIITAVGALVWVGGFVALAASRQRRKLAATTLLIGGLFTLGLLVVIGVAMAVSWWEFFQAFHAIFFESGTWMFDYSDTLIRLFPIRFWMDVAMVAVVLLVVEAILIGVVGWVWRRRLKAVA